MSNTPFSKQRAYTGLVNLSAPDSQSIVSVTGKERWMKFNLRALALAVGCLCFLSRPIHGAGKYLQVEYPPSTVANHTWRSRSAVIEYRGGCRKGTRGVRRTARIRVR